MDDKERLKKWMETNGFDVGSLAEATGMAYGTVYLIATGRRDVNDGFKYRFVRSFGLDAGKEIFADLSRSNLVAA